MTRVRPRSSLAISTFENAATEGDCLVDLSELRFVDVHGLVGAAVAILESREPSSTHFVAPLQPRVAEHLSYMGFARFLDDLGCDHGLPVRDPADRDDVVVPLIVVDDVSAVEALSHLLFAQLQRTVDPQVLNAVTEALWELAANVLEHSGARAVIAGQVYRDGEPPHHDGKVLVVIGDAGRGIRASFLATGLHRPETDREAIELAVEYLVSSVPDQGRGQGLHTTIAEVTGLGGSVVVRSGVGRLSVRDHAATHSLVTHMSGTMVTVSLPVQPGRSNARRHED